MMAGTDYHNQTKSSEHTTDANGATDGWVATVARLQARIPALGSVASINRYLIQKDGIPHRRLGRRLIFYIPDVCAWLSRQVA
jgi:hypothetical protein